MKKTVYIYLNCEKMPTSAVKCWLLLPLLWISTETRLQEHRQFQYNSLIDGRGTYNFAYDTSHEPGDAHSMRMEYRDENGIVRGRYGYTDPRGILRVVEYEAGPDGYKARGDVGPDLFPHMEAPGLAPPKPISPQTPLRMSGWDPARDPINQRIAPVRDSYTDYKPVSKILSRDDVRYVSDSHIHRSKPSYIPVSQKIVEPVVKSVSESHIHRSKPSYIPVSQEIVEPVWKSVSENRIHRSQPVVKSVSESHIHRSQPVVKSVSDSHIHRSQPVVKSVSESHVHRSKPSSIRVSQIVEPDVEIFQQEYITNQKKSKPIIQNQPLTIHNIDVHPDDIRVAIPPASYGSSAPILSLPIRSKEVVVASAPEIVYDEGSSRRGVNNIDRYDSSYSRDSPYYSYGRRIYQPRPVAYRSRPTYDGQQYYFD